MAVVAIVAIVAHFGAETLHLPWLRETALLVILAEILAFVALERYQVFEPMQETVQDVQAQLSQFQKFREELAASGHVTVQPSPHEHLREAARALRESSSADPGGAHIIRHTAFGLRWHHVSAASAEDSEEAKARGEYLDAFGAFFLAPGSTSMSPWVHRWSVRFLFAVGDIESYQAMLLETGPVGMFARRALHNGVIKLMVTNSSAALSPLIIGERDVFLKFEDPSSPLVHWSIRFRGPQYAALFSRWFDELWQLPEAYTVYARDGINQQGLEQVRQKLAALRKSD
ncbi:MAG: hypothetical protein ACREQB_08740 [Candidatus Binataceae bacterium]